MGSMSIIGTTLAFFSAGTGEILILFLVGLVLFGPRRLPELARWTGKILEYLRRASQDFRDQIVSLDKPMPRDRPTASDDLSPYREAEGETATDAPESPSSEAGDHLAG